MEYKVSTTDVFGFVKPSVDVHTMGIYTMANLLRDCGYKVVIAKDDINSALECIQKLNNYGIVKKWILDNNINRLGFSYRLDPQEGYNYFMNLYLHLFNDNMLIGQGGIIKELSFAGLPQACKYINSKIEDIIVFPGDETPVESLEKYGIPSNLYPKTISISHEYDSFLFSFAKELVSSEEWKKERPLDHYGYKECGRDNDSYLARLTYAQSKKSLPIIRTHSGPYNIDREEALREYSSWCKDLSKSKLLDVLSIGTSQLTQSNFGENWNGKPNGGGVPINSELEYCVIKENAKPMLVRTYSGTKDVPKLAEIHERSLNICWHALSFWWFNKLDGRGNNDLLSNLKEHFEATKYIVSTGKPIEPNVPHHFAFRGSDDVSYIVSAVLVAKALKKMGVKHMILQNMLNTPKYTIGIQDIAKGRVMVDLVRELEDGGFKVSLQTRAGLDYFSPDLDTAKIQLAAVTCMMDDIEANNENSPEIIHVVNYSEAVCLATPPIIKDSIKITLNALRTYRNAKRKGIAPSVEYSSEIQERYDSLLYEAREAIDILEHHIPNLYTPEGFYTVFKEGFFPVPYLMDPNREYPKATKWKTAIKNGGVKVVDDDGNILPTKERYNKIIDQMK